MTPFPLSVRDAFTRLPGEAHHTATTPPNWAATFTPQGHQGALDPARTIVIGDRGTGKSFWSSVLVDDEMRTRVARQYPALGLDRVVSALGFSGDQFTERHPTAGIIGRVARAEDRTEALWRAVLLKRSPFPPAALKAVGDDWEQATGWVAADPALRNAEFRDLDATLAREGLVYVLVFDALDLIAERWSDIRSRMRGLIRVAVAVRSLRFVRMKLFLRPDMAEDQAMWAVGDASKLRHNEVPLRWRRRDLYGLLWTLLANAEHGGEAFREHCQRLPGARFALQDGSWRPGRELTEEEGLQEEIFHALAGQWMGRDRRRGNTFTWVPNHLADAVGSAAPRSFLLAMQDAADDAKSTEFVLDRAGIEEGVRKASRVRVRDELAEDYRWMPTVLNALQGLTVPIDPDQLIARWRERGTLGALRSLVDQEGQDQRFIPPGRVLEEATDETNAYQNLITTMTDLRIFFELTDGRINMPDLFRLEARIKRRGGMRPLA